MTRKEKRALQFAPPAVKVAVTKKLGLAIPAAVWLQTQPGSTCRGANRGYFQFPKYVTA